MNVRKLLFGVMALALIPVQAWACACCSDEGEYRISFHKPSSYELGLMKEMRFGKSANLIETQANVAEELKSPSSQANNYSLIATLAGGVWKLNFRDGNKSGMLSLPLPPKMLSYVVDTHDGQQSPGGGPVLYKEWRFEGRADGQGFFKSSTPSTYFLVLQGRGNRCDNAEDFSHWRLELKGPRARYAFFGELIRGN